MGSTGLETATAAVARAHGAPRRRRTLAAVTRDQLEHALRAVRTVTDESVFVIIGSQAILGQFPDAPEELLISPEVDIYAPANPEASDLIQGACREHADFPRTHEFYIDGVSPTTAVVPGGWRNRAIPLCNRKHHRSDRVVPRGPRHCRREVLRKP